MRDLTSGSINQHIIHMAVPIAIGMVVQTVYYLVDLYFVGRLGMTALAGVNAAGNVAFLVLGLTQILGVGTVALISQAVGRKDRKTSNLVFNQAISIAIIIGVVTLVGGYGIARPYLEIISSDQATINSGVTYLYWFIPNLAMQFSLVAMGSALRGTGIVKPTMIVQLVSIVINIILAPVLIAGWLTGIPLGVAGAGLASSIAIFVAVILMWRYFNRLERYVNLDWSQVKPQFDYWKKILAIGFPAGGEFLLMFFYSAVIYWLIQDFGPSAQAGFGLGSRIMQAIFVPALSIAFAMPAVVGQNFGAKQAQRVRETFNHGLLLVTLLLLLLALFTFWKADILLSGFSDDPEVILVGATFLHLIAINYIPSGVIFTTSGVLQGLGNSWPAFFGMMSRLVMFVIPAVWISQYDWFEINHIWYLSIATVFVQAGINYGLLQREFRRKLVF